MAALEAQEFAAQVRAARAILGWGQRELAEKAGMTQKSIYRIEKGDGDIRRSTMVALETVFSQQGISFQPMSGGGFLISVAPGAAA